MENQPHPYDRRHLKEVLHKNELTDTLYEARDWAKTHLEAVLIGALVLAAAVFGVVFFINGQKDKSLQASLLLTEAQGVFQQSGSLPAAQASQGFTQAFTKFQAISSTYEGTPQAKAAQLGMANADLALGKAADAEREYAALDSRDATNPISALAALGRARALEFQGKAADALKAYGDVLSAYAGTAVAGQAKDAQDRLGKLPLKK